MANGLKESSESTSDDSDTDLHPHKRAKLQVPTCVGTLFQSRVDDPAKHQGRQRCVAHVDGNYATLLYLSIGSRDSWSRCASYCEATLKRLATATSELLNGEPEIHVIDHTSPPGWHVSLGPMVMLRAQFIGPFLRRLENACKEMGPLGPFEFEAGVEVFASKHGGRSFAGPVVSEAYSHKLRNVVAVAKSCCEAFGLVEEHHSPDSMRLHCSLAWTCADVEAGLVKCGAERHESEYGVSWRLPGQRQEHGKLSAPGHSLLVKVGERTHAFPFGDGLTLGIDTDSDHSEVNG